MELEVVRLDAVDPVEGAVEHAVQDEPDDVQGQEVEVQANHAEKNGWKYKSMIQYSVFESFEENAA